MPERIKPYLSAFTHIQRILDRVQPRTNASDTTFRLAIRMPCTLTGGHRPYLYYLPHPPRDDRQTPASARDEHEGHEEQRPQVRLALCHSCLP